jgi:hypothetical protein
MATPRPRALTRWRYHEGYDDEARREGESQLQTNYC